MHIHTHRRNVKNTKVNKKYYTNVIYKTIWIARDKQTLNMEVTL